MMARGEIAAAARVLRRAASVLASRQPAWQCNVIGECGTRYFARFEWPGVLTVCDFHTGAFLVRSKPGDPFTAAS